MPALWTRIKARFRNLFLPSNEWREEVESHLYLSREWHERTGPLSNREAAQTARRRFGSPTRTVETIRDLYPAHWLEDLWHDLAFAARGLRRYPAFAVSLIATAALGIAAATTIFSIVDPLLFRPLPYRDGARLVSFGLLGPIDTDEFSLGAMYPFWQSHQTSFSQVTAMRLTTDCDLQTTPPRRLRCAAVESTLLPTLGVSPALGHNFTLDDDRPHAPLTALLSHPLWQSAFAGQRGAIGKVVQIDSHPVRVIGVLPAGFLLPQGEQPDLLFPAQIDFAALHAPGNTVFLRCFARLKPGISIAAARRRLEPVFQATLNDVPPELRRAFRFTVQSVRDRSIGRAKLASSVLFAAVLFLLFLAYLTVANLLLARAIARSEEFAMRAALGANRSRLLRQSLAETALLATASAGLGILLSSLFLRALVAWTPGGFLRLPESRIDSRVLLFSLAAALAVILFAGLLPALFKPASLLARTWQTTTLHRARLRQCLVVLQLACSLILLTGALLLSRSLARLEAQPLGLSGGGLVAATIHLSHASYPNDTQVRNFYLNWESRLATVGGISSWSLSDSIPPAGISHTRPLANIVIAGHPAPPSNSTAVTFRYITPGYFPTLGIPLLYGRNFTAAERAGAETSVILSRGLARRLFTGDPLGQRLSFDGPTGPWLTVIGIAQDVKNNGLDAPAAPEYYRLRTRSGNPLSYTAVALLRTPLTANAVRALLQQQAARLDPTLTVDVAPVPELLQHLADRPRFLAVIVNLFALVSLVLAGSGLFGVISFLVANRAREIAVRSALGASRARLLWLVGKQTAVWALLGITIGAAGALSLSRFIQALLFETAPYDPSSLAIACLAVLALALAAAIPPARRATRLDPARLLRSD